MNYVENKCHECQHVRSIPGNCHIRCSNPDKKMTGDAHGIRMGWFIYPLCFDPVWMTKKCSNFEPTDHVAKQIDISRQTTQQILEKLKTNKLEE